MSTGCLRFFLTLVVVWAIQSSLHPAAPQTGPEWNLSNAAHLMRRAGFSASPTELQRIVEQGFQVTVDELIDFEQVDDSALDPIINAPRSPNGRSYLKLFGVDEPEINPVAHRDLWHNRMLRSRRQLIEKMTLFWHDHFATSADKVFQATFQEPPVPLMAIQHDLLRRHALGNFRDLVRDVARDPAMLWWLDNVQNIQGNPNENWARELLELFTLGLGHYTEVDVQEAARAFTGWSFSFSDGLFRFIPSLHDDGEKTFLGLTGHLNGDDIIDRIFEQPQAAIFLTRKLWEFFVYPNPSDAIVQGLADSFRQSGYELKPLMRAILEHPEFFSPRAFRSLVKSPTELAIGFFREAGILNSGFSIFSGLGNGPNPELMDRFGAGTNQLLLEPFDVDGWPTGPLWLSTGTLFERYRLFSELLESLSPIYIDSELEVEAHALPDWLVDIVADQQISDSESLLEHLYDRFLQQRPEVSVRLALTEYLGTGPDGQPQEFGPSQPQLDVKIRGALYLIVALPEYQLK